MKIAAITGCDSGIGKSLVSRFTAAGYTTIISYLEHNPFKDIPQITAQKLDLLDEGQINSFASTINRYCNESHSLDFFINNAGIAMGGPFENLSMETYRMVFEINLFGLMSLTQKILPSLIKSRGRLVVVGSLAGRIALPFLSPYTSSKFALEGWCDSVRRELNPFGIKTILLEPGGIATPIWTKALAQDSSFADKKYEESLGSFREKFIESGTKGMDTDKAAARIFGLISKKRPKARYIVSGNNLLARLELLVPNRVLDTLVAKMFSMNYGDSDKP